MKLRFYLRGLGIGMAVTAIVLHFALAGAQSYAMSDAQVRERAAELGMVDSQTTLADAGAAEQIELNTDAIQIGSAATAASDASTDDAEGSDGGEAAGTADAEGSAEATDTAGTGSATGTSDTAGTGNATGTADTTGTGSATGTADTTGTGTNTDASDAIGTGSAIGTADTTGTGNTAGASDTTGTGNTAGASDTTGTGNTADASDVTGTGDAAGASDAATEAGGEDGAGETDAQDGVGEDAAGEDHGRNTRAVQITIVSGDGSYTVARRVAEAGIVPSAAEFDEFLCSKGYDRHLVVGTHSIPAGASYDEIGRILTSR